MEWSPSGDASSWSVNQYLQSYAARKVSIMFTGTYEMIPVHCLLPYFFYLLEPANHYFPRFSDQNTEFTSFCPGILYSCACDDILINLFVAGGYIGHDMRCRMLTVIEKSC